MIKIDNLSLAYGVKNISCHIPQGKLVGIMGANGAGKSSLLKAIAGILPLSQGEIALNGQPLQQMSLAEKSKQIAYFAQSTKIYWDLSVYDVIALGLPESFSLATDPASNCEVKVRSEKRTFFSFWRSSTSSQTQYAIIQQIAQRFSVEHLLNKPFQQLSGGEKARVQLARCCVKNTPILLADEPIAPLDPYYQLDIMEQLKSLTPHTTCIVAIHHLDLAYRFCDEIILLYQGNLMAYGETKGVLNTDNLAAAFGVRAEVDVNRRQLGNLHKL